MEKRVIGPVAEFPPGARKHVEIDGRGIAVFNTDGAFYALRDICPHLGARLSDGTVHGWVDSDGPGCYSFDASRKLVRCPWHGWEYELATGQSWYDPADSRVRSYPATVERGEAIVEDGDGDRLRGPYVAETIPISVEDDYLVIEL